MSKRLQVLVDDEELAGFQDAAQRQGLTLSEWVRASLRSARSSTSSVDPAGKLTAIRAARRHAFPAPDIDQMLAEIEAGYLGPGSPDA